MLTERTQLAAKIEQAEGTGETLAAADALHCLNPVFTPDITMNKRKPITSSLSQFASIPGARFAAMEFDCELKGSGTKGTPPALGKLLKCCGFGEAVVAVTSVTYAPASTAISSMTLALYMDGVVHKIWGARGDARLVLKNGEIPLIHFSFTGADFSVVDGALLTGITYETTKPVAFMAAQLQVQSYAALIASMEISVGNTLAPRRDANAISGYKSVVISARESMMTFDPEKVTVATHDFYGLMKSGTEGALTTTIGATEGNICTITGPKIQYVKIGEADRDRVRTLGIDCQLNRNAGDDELSFAFT